MPFSANLRACSRAICGGYGAAIHHDRTFRQAIGDAALEQDLGYGLAVGQHGEDDSCAGNSIGRRGSDVSTVGDQRLGFGGVTVPHRNRKTGTEQAPRHRCPHQARAENGNLRLPAHSFPPSSSSM